MLQRKDLLLSVIEEMGKALAKLTQAQDSNDQNNTDYALEEFLNLLSLDLHTVRTQNPVDIIQALNDPRLKPYLVDALNIYLASHDDPQLRTLYNALAEDLKQDKIIAFSDFAF
ncbi:MAG: hypothetical protein ACRCXN_06885 [Bacteroidales bacterium]